MRYYHIDGGNKVNAGRKIIFTKSFAVLLTVVVIIAGLNIFYSYNKSSSFLIGGETYKLAEYPNDTDADVRTYIFTSDTGWENGGTTLTVEGLKACSGASAGKGPRYSTLSG
jgi:hypothetical protein